MSFSFYFVSTALADLRAKVLLSLQNTRDMKKKIPRNTILMVRFGIYFVSLCPKKKQTMAIQWQRVGEQSSGMDAIFRRSELLLGEEAMERIAQKRVIIFGVGGVGSWCAESLVRSGIRQLTIVDSDRVCITNINRQLMATSKTVGQVKVEALKERLLSINPSAEITALQKIFSQETAEEFALDSYDYIIDAIDSLKDKAALILLACKTNAKLFSSMGAALKLDPTRIKVTEFWKVQGDPLARALRKKFKHYGQYPEQKFQVVYSDELLENRGCPTDEGEEPSSFNKPQTNGTLAHITAIFGFMLAGLVIQDATS
jgi:tRNA A37 threonylcarbamoyladenosine dehydratase